MHQASAMMSARDALIPEVPEAPSGLSATTVDDTKVDLDWTDNSSGLSQEDDFEIEYDTESDFSSPSSTTAAQDAISKRISGLSNSTTYYFRIRARNNTGNSDWSNTDSATTDSEPSDPPDGAPSSLSATADDEDSVSLTWTDNSTNEDEFEIQYDTDSNFGTPSTKVVAANSTSTTVSSLAEGTEYHFRVRASNTDGDSDWSNVDSSTTKLNPPTNFQGVDKGDFIRFSWTENSGLEENVEIYKDGSLFDTLAANTEQYDVNEPTSDGTWKVRVIHSSLPNSDFSNTASGPPWPT